MSPEEFKNFIDENMKHNWREARIVNKLWKAFKDAGNPIVQVNDTEEVTDVKTRRELQEIVFNLDECYLIPKNGGWIRIILGNEWDAICDYTVNLEETIEPVNDYIDNHPDNH